jgi:hypothetical protein
MIKRIPHTKLIDKVIAIGKLPLVLAFWLLASTAAFAVDDTRYVASQNGKGRFALSSAGKSAPLYVHAQDYPGVIRAAKDLQTDINRVTQALPSLSSDKMPAARQVVLIGTLGKSPVIDQLVQQKKLDVTGIAGKWETFLIQVLDKPMPGVDQALVMVGSDKRGTIFGIYDLSAQIGVSPWHWWADVPVRKQKNLFVLPGRHTQGEPKVKYRGIFINDEAPCLSGWTHEKNGGFNQKLYTKVFELILRSKGNFLWPAMWGNAFHVDDPMNPVLADEYGVVIGTSHHEPLMRAHDEWKRFGNGKWDYTKNDSTLREFWRSSLKERHRYENLVTVGMRGDGDEPMSRETATTLLEKIVADQRTIIAEVTGKPASEKPQVWALYKEVQDYYDKGMRVPDDVTLLLCDDNWGNIRKLPDLNAQPRKGGFGIYYHFDYVGGPRNYKWVNTNPLPRIWEQMHLAYQYNARQLWVVNVGDIKPMELPISFFLDYAWNPEAMGIKDMGKYTHRWANQTFGETHATEIASFLDKYAKYNARVKPELLSPDTYSLDHYNEFETVVTEYNQLADRARKVYDQLAPEYRDAYYQLVLYPILACANLNELYYTVALNRKYAREGHPETNALADKAERLYKKDAELSNHFNTELAGGKWNHFADQTHIGYTYWQQPPENKMPKVERLEPSAVKATMVKESAPVNTPKPALQPDKLFKGFVEGEGYVSMEAEHYTRALAKKPISWKVIPDIGRTAGGVTVFPVNIPPVEAGGDTPRLEYDLFLADGGEMAVQVILSPTLEFNGNRGLRYAISIDDEMPQVVEIHKDRSMKEWERSVATNSKVLTTRHSVAKAGKHTLKFWMVDPAVVVQKIVVDRGGVKPSYLGPPESQQIK